METRNCGARSQVEMYYFVSEYDLYINNCITYVKKNYEWI
jgi:hypothetical protein